MSGRGLLVLPLAIATLRLVTALSERNPAFDEVVLAACIAGVCAGVLLIDLRQRRQHAHLPEDDHEC